MKSSDNPGFIGIKRNKPYPYSPEYSFHRSIIRRLIMMCLPVFVLNPASYAQLKIYISTDLEGVSGVYKFAQTREKDSPLNIQACEYFMGDLAAVIRGLKDAGVSEIVVSDGHGNRALIPHLMEPGAKYITGIGKTEVKIFDSSFSGIIMFGYHAMMGTPDGVLNHTQNSIMEKRFWYNDVESGELAQVAIGAGTLGVPPIMVTGDEATCREARKFFGDEIITVATKQGIGREAAVLYPFGENRKALYEGAKKAVAAIPKCKPYTVRTPVKVKYQYLDQTPGLTERKVITEEWVSPDTKNLLSPPK
jgi:D-amino peptidase